MLDLGPAPPSPRKASLAAPLPARAFPVPRPRYHPRVRLTGALAAIALAALGGCFDENPMVGETTDTSSTSASCERGTVGCTCFPNGTCDAGLSCDAGICAPLEPTSADGSTSTTTGSTSSSGAVDSTDSTGSSTSTSSTSADSSSSDDSSTGSTDPAHILFTTSTSHTGLEVGGLVGADAICNALGQAVRAGPWVAVLRDAVTTFAGRIVVRGEVVNTLGELLAIDEAELLTQTLQNAPGYDETGAPISNMDLVWTGSRTDDCIGWSLDDPAFLGTVGLPMDPERWLDSTVPLPCSAAPRLYCISQ
jgi:hypothetical protein